MTNGSGVFLTVEGIDGCGKTTQTGMLCTWLAEVLGEENVLRTFEPGGWAGGPLLRELLLGGTPLSSRTELLLFLADRSGHVDSLIAPALSQGKWVVCERYTDSTLAYQSWGRGLDLKAMEELLAWCRFPQPTVTLLLDIDVETALSRVKQRGGRDRIESEGVDLMRRVSDGYKALAERHPDRFLTVDASPCPKTVAERIRSGLKAHLAGLGLG